MSKPQLPKVARAKPGQGNGITKCIPNDPRLTQERAPDKWLVQERVGILRKKSAPCSAAAPDKWLVQKRTSFENKFCPQQRSCPGQVVSFNKNECFGKSSAPGSEAAQDKWFLLKKVSFLKKSAPGSEAAREK